MKLYCKVFNKIMSNYYLITNEKGAKEIKQIIEEYIKEMVLQGYLFDLDAKENLNEIIKKYVSNKII